MIGDQIMIDPFHRIIPCIYAVLSRNTALLWILASLLPGVRNMRFVQVIRAATFIPEPYAYTSRNWVRFRTHHSLYVGRGGLHTVTLVPWSCYPYHYRARLSYIHIYIYKAGKCVRNRNGFISPFRKNMVNPDYRRLAISDLLNPVSSSSSAPSESGRGRGSGRGATGSAASSGTRAIKCSYCNRTFASRDELSIHRMQSHASSYVCQVCNSSFFDRGNLNKHVSI